MRHDVPHDEWVRHDAPHDEGVRHDVPHDEEVRHAYLMTCGGGLARMFLERAMVVQEHTVWGIRTVFVFDVCFNLILHVLISRFFDLRSQF